MEKKKWFYKSPHEHNLKLSDVKKLYNWYTKQLDSIYLLSNNEGIMCLKEKVMPTATLDFKAHGVILFYLFIKNNNNNMKQT